MRTLTSETPVNSGAGGVAFGFQSLGFAQERSGVADAPVPALTVKDAQVQLGHVEPTAVLGRVMQFQLTGNLARFVRFEGFLQRGQLMGAQVVEHDADSVRGRIALHASAISRAS
jgi:hypothetical protein